MRKVGLILALITIVLFVWVAQAVAWTGYGTGFGTSSWSGFKVHTTVYYQNNISSSVQLRDMSTHIDNRDGDEWTLCSLGKVFDGNGAVPVDHRHTSFQVAPGDYKIDYFDLYGSTYYKYGNLVLVRTGATLTGNCGFGFGGWEVRFWPDGGITKTWTE